jgi:circadian clock protein KaiC
MNKSSQASAQQCKAPTGIVGLDDITGGGLPQGRTTLLEGTAGSGKTMLALQTLVNGARDYDEPGIFVTFEESSGRVMANAERFGWDVSGLLGNRLFFLDAQPSADLIQSGDFDLNGMLAALEAKVKEMGARRIAIDAVDIVLAMQNDPVAVRREAYRLHDWLLARDLTALITAKSATEYDGSFATERLGFLQFMVDCSIVIRHDLTGGVSQRNLRVVKYRGSAFEENQAPFLFGAKGIEVASMPSRDRVEHPVTTERVSSGIPRLDTMLGGGYYRGANVIMTGSPGTAKTTLCGAFTEAACRRGEKTLFLSFDSRSDEVIRNLQSVKINLRPFVDDKMLLLVSARAIDGNAENHLMQIKKMALEFGPLCVVVDPISALSKSGDADTSHGVIERLIDWSKSEGHTMLFTSLLGGQQESTRLAISTISDTWLHLTYHMHAGERNRGLTIVKSRGTGHSNQIRELLLSDAGVTLADVYSAGGEVLMGTMRWEKERAERLARDLHTAKAEQTRTALQADVAQLEMRILSLRRELEAKLAEQIANDSYEATTMAEAERVGRTLQEKRGGLNADHG